MAINIKTDVVICGGGPAGASTALSLLRYTDRSVTIVEQSGLDRLKVGEQVSPALFNTLDYLGISREALPESTRLQGFTHLAAWGNPQLLSRHAINNVAGDSFQLDREHFDLMLVEEVVERGGQVLPHTRFVRATPRPDGGWELVARHKTKGQVVIQADYLVDASGRNAVLGRHLGAPEQQLDQLVGVGAFLEFEQRENGVPEVVMETGPEGWWYTAPLPGNRMTVTLFTDADQVPALGLNDPQQWLASLNRTRFVRQKTSGGKVRSGLWVRNAFTRLMPAEGVERYLPVGDAALSMDPLSSIGIGFAMTSGCHAARALDADLKGEAEFIPAYRESLQANFQDFTHRLKGYYAKEKRWLESPFWQRRAAIQVPV